MAGRVADAVLLEAVVAAAQRAGEPLTSGAYRRVRRPGDPGTSTLVERFGSWAGVVEAAGLGAVPLRRRWSRAETIDALRSWCAQREQPRFVDYQRESVGSDALPDETVLRRHFGGWRAAVRAALGDP